MTTRAYLRISLASERSGSITKQRERIAAAERAAGRDPDAVEWYIDEGVSGSRAVERPGRDRLLADLRRNDRLVALKVDRLARNVRDLLAIADHTKDVGAALQLVDDSIDTSGPMGEFLLTLLGAVAQLEAANTAERVRASRESFKSAGRHSFGKLPIGFRAIPNPDGDGLVVATDPETAPLVREAVMRVLAGESQNTVRHSLNLSKTGMHNLLSNPRLAGMTPDNGGVVIENGSPRISERAALLSLTEWDELRAFMARSEKAWSKASGYGRVIRCGHCQDRMYLNVGGRKKEYATYRCRKVNHAPGEPGLSVMRDAANATVEEQFLFLFADMPYRIAVVTEDDSARREALAVANLRLAEIERSMDEATDAETEDRLGAEWLAAKRDRKRAEAMPAEHRETVRDTGQTVGEVWADADDMLRETLMSALGSFVVVPGTRGKPITERLMWVGLMGPETPEGEPVVFRVGDSGPQLWLSA